jgi:hypothetical protein
MPKNVRIREPLTGSPTLEYLNERMGAGWKLVALEWEKPGYPPTAFAWWRIPPNGRSSSLPWI